MVTFVALLRGINVGGRNTIPMAELQSALSSLGLEDVVTYIQSGNVVFRSGGGPVEIAHGIERRIAEVFSTDVTVVLRTAAELERIAGGNPFLEDEDNLSRLHVVFLGNVPTPTAAANLDPGRSTPDSFTVCGCEIYVHYPNGAGRSKLTNDYFERTLGVRSTARNWNTVLRMLELTRR